MTQLVNVQLDKLVALQRLDNGIKDLKNSLGIIPKQIADAQKQLESKKSRLKGLEEEIKDLQKQRNQCEQDVKAQNDHMIKTQQKLPSVKTNKEYTAILAEVEAVKVNIGEIEEKELGIMELLDQKEAGIPEARSEYEGYQKEFEEYKAKKDAEQARAEKELEEEVKRREELFNAIDPKWSREYQNIYTRREELAVVLLKGETCQGCFQQIQPQVAIEVKSSDKLIHSCQSCARILYCEPEAAEETESAVSK